MKLVLSTIILTIIFNFSCSKNSTTEPEKDFFDVQGPNGFVGKIAGTNAFVAILVRENESIAYACNGDEEIYEWFSGPTTDPADINLTNAAGAQISVKFAANAFEGQVTLSNDKTFTLTATPNIADIVGIFRVIGTEAEQDPVKAGWIVDSERNQRGALLIGGRFQPAPALNFDEIKDGTSNTILIGDKRYSLFRYTR